MTKHHRHAIRKRLQLTHETVRQLSADEIVRVAGGILTATETQHALCTRSSNGPMFTCENC